LHPAGAASEGQQSDVARALDGDTEPALMARADARHAARENLAAFLDELRQDVGALIVDEVHLLDAEFADFFLAEILALSAGTTSGAAGSTRTAFAASATGTTFAASPTTVTAFPTRRALTAAVPATLRLSTL
jgi:hypothetical protein